MKYKMTKAVFLITTLFFIFIGGINNSFAADVHKILLHIDENNKQKMNLLLNNAANINKYYQDLGEEAHIEIVAYGPGLHMLREDTSPVKKRIKSFQQNFDNISFKACGNTHRKMAKKEGKEIKLLKEAQEVPSGITYLITRSESGWTYIRP